MSHRSEVLSQEQWDTITLLLPELMDHAPSWRSNHQLFEGILWPLRSVPVGQIYRTDTPSQRVGLDDVVGKKTGRGYGCSAG